MIRFNSINKLNMTEEFLSYTDAASFTKCDEKKSTIVLRDTQ